MTTTPTSPPGFRDGIDAAANEVARLMGEEYAFLQHADFLASELPQRIRAIPTPDTLPTGWNSDMGEAPRDGTTILVFGRPGDIDGVEFGAPGIHSAYWDSIDGAFCLTGATWIGPFIEPTHWMLPPPPPGE